MRARAGLVAPQRAAGPLARPLMSTIGELGTFLSRETAAAAAAAGSSPAPVVPAPVVGEPEQAGGTPQANGDLVPG